MCGIAGLLTPAGADADALARRVQAMADAIAHRGPDQQQVWTDGATGIGLGFRRLAIVDLTPTGHQPMPSADGRFMAVFNGEIYNYREIRAELAATGVTFRGTSDTEVLIEACARWGVELVLPRLVGMFALALWDRERRELTLARDGLGIKPLYWALRGTGTRRTLLFGSELKALRAADDAAWPLDPAAVDAFLRMSYVPAPGTIYRDARKLPAGTRLVWRADAEPVLIDFWQADAVARAGIAARDGRDPDAAADGMRTALRDAVARQTVADVAVGAFLSGGIDSALVTALMQEASARPVRSFSIGFEDADYDESRYAAAVARHLGTEHTELVVDTAAVARAVPDLAAIHDEPLADASQLPTLLVSRLARRDVTVALSGDGGDEVFAGYNRYRWAERIWRRMARVPAPLRHAAAAGATSLSPDLWDQLFRGVPQRLRPRQAGDKMHKLAGLLGVAGPDALYRRLTERWPDPPLAPDLARDLPECRAASLGEAAGASFLDRMQIEDTRTYLMDDVLAKVDRTSMAASLEVRVPLLDQRVFAAAWALPPALKLRDGRTKAVLRDMLARYVPPALTDRPKSGFSLPLGQMLRRELRPWAEELLSPARLEGGGLLQAAPVRRLWAQHLAGQRNHEARLWNVLMLLLWQQRWGSQGGAAR